jgi:hypothetical protein
MSRAGTTPPRWSSFGNWINFVGVPHISFQFLVSRSRKWFENPSPFLEEIDHYPCHGRSCFHPDYSEMKYAIKFQVIGLIMSRASESNCIVQSLREMPRRSRYRSREIAELNKWLRSVQSRTRSSYLHEISCLISSMKPTQQSLDIAKSYVEKAIPHPSSLCITQLSFHFQIRACDCKRRHVIRSSPQYLCAIRSFLRVSTKLRLILIQSKASSKSPRSPR